MFVWDIRLGHLVVFTWTVEFLSFSECVRKMSLSIHEDKGLCVLDAAHWAIGFLAEVSFGDVVVERPDS